MQGTPYVTLMWRVMTFNIKIMFPLSEKYENIGVDLLLGRQQIFNH
jgi:hypothetical protein